MACNFSAAKKWVVRQKSDIIFNWSESEGRKSVCHTNFAKDERGEREENETFDQKAKFLMHFRNIFKMSIKSLVSFEIDLYVEFSAPGGLP